MRDEVVVSRTWPGTPYIYISPFTSDEWVLEKSFSSLSYSLSVIGYIQSKERRAHGSFFFFLAGSPCLMTIMAPWAS